MQRHQLRSKQDSSQKARLASQSIRAKPDHSSNTRSHLWADAAHQMEDTFANAVANGCKGRLHHSCLLISPHPTRNTSSIGQKNATVRNPDPRSQPCHQIARPTAIDIAQLQQVSRIGLDKTDFKQRCNEQLVAPSGKKTKNAAIAPWKLRFALPRHVGIVHPRQQGILDSNQTHQDFGTHNTRFQIAEFCQSAITTSFVQCYNGVDTMHWLDTEPPPVLGTGIVLARALDRQERSCGVAMK